MDKFKRLVLFTREYGEQWLILLMFYVALTGILGFQYDLDRAENVPPILIILFLVWVITVLSDLLSEALDIIKETKAND